MHEQFLYILIHFAVTRLQKNEQISKQKHRREMKFAVARGIIYTSPLQGIF